MEAGPAARARRRAAIAPSTPSGSRRATGSGRATSRPTRRPSRRASGSRSRSTRPAELHRAATRSSRRARPGRASACAASSSTIRARSASATSRSGSTARIVGRVTSGGSGYAVERSIAYRLPPARRADRDARRDRGLRAVGRLRGRPRPALGPDERADPLVSASPDDPRMLRDQSGGFGAGVERRAAGRAGVGGSRPGSPSRSAVCDEADVARPIRCSAATSTSGPSRTGRS